MVKKINAEQFAEAKKSAVALVDFSATWCGPCRMLGPVIEEIAGEYEGRVKVGKVNVDEEPELAGRFRVSGIPTVILFRDGKQVDEFVGYRPKEEVAAFLGRA